MRAFLCVLVLATGCVRFADEPKRWKCDEHDDCPDGLRCMDADSFSGGYCVGGPYCSDSDDCFEGTLCRQGTCQTPECSTEADPVCKGYTCDVEAGACRVECDDYGTPCQSGFYCSAEGTCAANCTDDLQCGEGQVCSDGRCLGRACNDDSVCGDYRCGVDNRCKTSCSNDDFDAYYDCRAGLLCDGEDHTCKTCDEACAPFACLDGACAEVCGDDADCAQGYDCERRSGQCVLRGTCEDASCGAYTCNGSTCATSCLDIQDCAPGFECSDGGTCEAACNDVTCAPYACAAYGSTCVVECDGDEDCAAGNRCDTATAECVEPTVGDCFDFECAPYACSPFGGCRSYCPDASYCAPGFTCEPDGQYCY